MSFAITLVAALVASLATAFLQALTGLDAWTPDLTSVLVLWLGLSRPGTEGAITAVAIGALCDGFAGSPLGFHMVHALLLYYVTRLVASRVRFHGAVGNVLLGTIGGAASLLLLLLVARVFLAGTTLHLRVMTLALPRLLLTTLAVLAVFPILARLEGVLVTSAAKDAF